MHSSFVPLDGSLSGTFSVTQDTLRRHRNGRNMAVRSGVFETRVPGRGTHPGDWYSLFPRPIGSHSFMHFGKAGYCPQPWENRG